MTTEATTETTTPPPKRRTFSREIRVKLSEEEVLDRGRKLAAVRDERGALFGEAKASAKSYGGKLAQLDAKLDGLTDAVNSGRELRLVDLYEERVGNVVEIRRADNDEVIEARKPTIAEQNESLFTELEMEPPVTTETTEQERPTEKGEGQGDDEDDFGGQQARAAGKLELVKSATGADVAHMPDDDEGETPEGDVDQERKAKPKKAGGKSKAKR